MATTTHLTDAAVFLTDAAHILRATAPETAAHLMRCRSDVVQHSDLQFSDIQRQQVCNACGHIMGPADDGTTIKLGQHTPHKSRNRSRPASLPRLTTVSSKSSTVKHSLRKRMTCGRCSNVTRVSLEKPSRVSRRKGKPVKDVAMPSNRSDSAKPSSGTTTKPGTANKKRAKDRKAGLQALLAANSKPKSSLNLSDFMR